MNEFIEWTSALLGVDVSGSVLFTSVNSDGEPLGSIVLANYRPGFNIEFGVATTKYGITRELLHAVACYVFGQLRLPRASIVVRATDQAQLAMVLRMGFIAEGVLKDWYGVGVDGIHFRITLDSLSATKFKKVLYYVNTRYQATRSVGYCTGATGDAEVAQRANQRSQQARPNNSLW